MDIDVCGPSVPKIMGVEGEQIHRSNAGWSPVFVQENLGVMSIGFMLPDPDEAVIWRGPKKNGKLFFSFFLLVALSLIPTFHCSTISGLIKQFLRDVNWGDLDYLVIDTPPGTSDEHLSIVQLLKPTGIDGAIVVTTPQEVALADVRKEINFCQKVGIPILGLVENMSGFVCPNCHVRNSSFFFFLPPTLVPSFGSHMH